MMLSQYNLNTFAASHLHLAKKITKLLLLCSHVFEKENVKILLERPFFIKVMLPDLLTVSDN